MIYAYVYATGTITSHELNRQSADLNISVCGTTCSIIDQTFSGSDESYTCEARNRAIIFCVVNNNNQKFSHYSEWPDTDGTAINTTTDRNIILSVYTQGSADITGSVLVTYNIWSLYI